MSIRLLQKNIRELLTKEPSKITRIGALSFFALAVIASYYIANLYSYGPAFLADEIGYLSKGAVYARYITDGASSYHGGYSLFLMPVFALFNDPFLIWKGIIFVNCLLFSGSFILLYHLLRHLFPRQKFWAVMGALGACAIYPTWIVMSGYSFATPAFVFVFVAAVLLFTRININKPVSALPFGLAVGFLYWIHIIGIGVIGAAFAIMLLFSIAQRKWRVFIIFGFSALVTALLYQVLIHELMNSVMTPTGYAAVDHYGPIEELLSSQLFNLRFWIKVGSLFVGQGAYMLVATLGIIGYSLVHTINKSVTLSLKKYENQENLVNLLMILSLVSVLMLGSVLFSLQYFREGVLRPDHWMYGRYTGMVVLPILGTGLLVKWKRTVALIMAATVWFAGMLLALVSTTKNTSDFNNIINTISFWPQYIITNVNFVTWFTLGAIGILAVYTLGKRLMILLLFFLMLMSIQVQQGNHEGILSLFSKPSYGLINSVRGSEATCVSFREYDYPSYEWQRLNMYKFYLYDLKLERSTFSEWKSNKCELYLSFDEELTTKDHILIGQENAFVNNLYLYSSKDFKVDRVVTENNDFIYKQGDEN